MKSFEALAVGVIAGLVVSSLCCNEKSQSSPCKKPLPRCEENGCCEIKKPDCKKCYYKRYYR